MRDVPTTLESTLRTTPPAPPPAPPASAEAGTPDDRPSPWSHQVRTCLLIGRRALDQIRWALQAREDGVDPADGDEVLEMERKVVGACVAGALAYLLNASPESVRPDPLGDEPSRDEVFVARFRGHLLCLLGMGVEAEMLDRALRTDVFCRRGEAERAPSQPVIPRYSLPMAPGLTLEEGLTLPGLAFGAAALRALQREAERDESYADLETLERGLYRRYLATGWAALMSE